MSVAADEPDVCDVIDGNHGSRTLEPRSRHRLADYCMAERRQGRRID